MIPLSTLPSNPGVYIYKDKHGSIIYIGKAKNIKKRVSSYFNKNTKSTKTLFLVKNIHDIDTIIVDNEVEALLLENKLIKKHKPKYNIMLKDAKTYAYIKLTDEQFPRILSTRKVTKKGIYFGPYTDGSARRELLELCVRVFKLRTCRTLPKRACLNFHIGLCTAPCVGKVREEEYQRQVQQAIQFLKGDSKDVIAKLEQDMKKASQEKKFEQAMALRNQLQSLYLLNQKQKVDLIKKFDQDVIGYVESEERCAIALFSISKGVISGKKEFSFEKDDEALSSFVKMYYSTQSIPTEIILNVEFWEDDEDKRSIEGYLSRVRGSSVRLLVPQKGEKKRLVKLACTNARYKLENKILQEIKDKLNLPTVPRTIECFDMSNLGYDYLVGAMVQYVDGKPNKDAYRKFEIKEKGLAQDDFASMYETVFRRYKRLRDEKQEMPDLIIIDGGKGQLGVALAALKELGLQIPIVGLAKREEELFLPGEEESRKFNKNSSMMLLIRQIRDSVHRFVLSYNRKKREMRMRSELQNKK